MANVQLVVAGVLGAVGVAAGAFGAHGLEGRLSPRDMDIFQTAVRYHLVHTLALFGVGLWSLVRPRSGVGGAGWAFVLGVAVFSGSLYLLVLTQARWLGAITPIGGLAFIVGWIWLAVRAAQLES